MGQKTSKPRTKTPHRASSKRSHTNDFQDTNNFNDKEGNDGKDDVILNGRTQLEVSRLQDEQSIQRLNDINSRNGDMEAAAPTDETDQIPQNIDRQNRYRVRRFRDKLASQLKKADIHVIGDTLLRSGIFNRKEYCEIKNQLHPKWMCWRLSYTLELKIRNDDLSGNSIVFDQFLECLRNPHVRRRKLAGRLSQESNAPCPSWCLDSKVEGVLDLADGLVLTPRLLESVLSHVHCDDQLSWWRWIPYELGMRNLNSDSLDLGTSDIGDESQHSKLKNALYEWGMTEGFARGGLEILILCFRNHIDACEVSWKGLKKIFGSRQF